LTARRSGAGQRLASFWAAWERAGAAAARPLFVLHLWGVFSLALSNVALGLAILSAPRRAWRALAPRFAELRPFALYVVGLLFAVGLSSDVRFSREELSELFNLATFPLAIWLIRDRLQARRVIDGLAVIGTAFALFGLAQYLADWGDIDRRIRGPFSHYMTFAGVLMLCSMLVLARLATGDGWRSAWRWIAFGVMQWGLWGSLTRSAWLASAAGITLVVLARRRRLLLAYAPAVALFIALAPVSWVERALSIAKPSDPSNYDRICMARAGLRMLEERPLFGIGPGLVKRRYGIYREPSAPRLETPHLHNAYLQIAAERGLVSLGAFLWLLGASSWAAFRGYRREGSIHGPRADLWLGTLTAVTALSVAALFENNWGDTEVQRVFLFALALPLILRGEDERREAARADA
jgi:O-antigen ligase